MSGVANAAAITAATTTFIALYDLGLTQAPVAWPMYCDEMPSTGRENTYDWAPLGISVREWKGDRQVGAVKVFDYSLKNRKWEASEAVPVDVYDDDDANMKLFGNRFLLLGQTAAKHPDKLLAEALVAGFTNTGPDGVAFFSNSHPTASGSNDRDNLASGTLNASNFELALDLLYKMKGYNGDALNVVGMGTLTLTVPPSLRSAAEAIVETQYLSGGATNINYKRAKLRVLPELEAESPTAWFVSIEGAPVKPLIFQMRLAPELYALTDPNTSEHVFKNDEMLYGTKARYEVGYGYPELIVGSTGV